MYSYRPGLGLREVYAELSSVALYCSSWFRANFISLRYGANSTSRFWIRAWTEAVRMKQ